MSIQDKVKIEFTVYEWALIAGLLSSSHSVGIKPPKELNYDGSFLTLAHRIDMAVRDRAK